MIVLYSRITGPMLRDMLSSLGANSYLVCLLLVCSLTFFGGLWGYGDRFLLGGCGSLFMLIFFYRFLMPGLLHCLLDKVLF